MASYNFAAILSLVAAILCLLTATILLIFSGGKQKSNLFLAASYLSFGLTYVVVTLVFNKKIIDFPHLYGTGNFFLLFYMPFSYLFMRSVAGNQRLGARQLVHLIPIILYVVDYSPFLFSSAAAKKAIISSELHDVRLIARYAHGLFFPQNAHIILRSLLMAIYWLLQLRLLASLTSIRNDKLWIRWLYIYNSLQPLIFIFPILAIVSGPKALPWAISVIPTAGGLLSAVTLFFYPRILYNMEKPSVRFGFPAKRKLSRGFLVEFPDRLDEFMREQKPYLSPDCTLEHLAEGTGVPAYKLSAFLNQVEQKHLSDYLNEWRINYCLEILKAGKLNHVNLQEIAMDCGFSNRAAFTHAFKKVVGIAPSIYLQKFEKN